MPHCVGPHEPVMGRHAGVQGSSQDGVGKEGVCLSDECSVLQFRVGEGIDVLEQMVRTRCE